MIDSLRRFFDKHIAAELERPGAEHREHAYRLATGALLFEVSRADHHISRDEIDTITSLLQTRFGMADDETQVLVELAQRESEEAVSLYDFTRLVDARLSLEEKVRVVELLWEVAFADGSLDRYEEYTIRKLADLLHVSHRDFIAAKLRVEQRVGGDIVRT